MGAEGLPGVLVWRALLSAVSVFNVAAWVVVAVTLGRRPVAPAGAAGGIGDRPTARRWQLLLSALFVTGCAFRSVWPRADVQRICLHDSWLSSVIVGRSVATLAELCIAIQWALLLRDIGHGTKSRAVTFLSQVLVPLIVIAEGFSWYAVLTTNYLGNVIEESTWTLTALLLTIGFIVALFRTRGAHRRFLGRAIALGAAYIVFMCTIDVPTYWTRWKADEKSGRAYLSLDQGLRDSSFRWVVTHDWNDWREEIPWMSLYFSVGVWISIALARAPRFEREDVVG